MALGPGISRRLFTGPACFSSASVASRAGSSGTVELCSARRCSRTRVLVSLCSDLRLIRSRAFRRAIAEVAKEENIEQSTEKKKRKETTSQSSSRGTQELSSTQEHKHKRGSSPEWACRSKCQGSLKSLYYIHHYVTIHLLVY